jgi:hypothetical protein
MARKHAKTKPTTSRPASKKRDKVAYEMWLTKKASRGPMEDRFAAEGLLLKDLQGRARPKGLQKVPGRKASK